MLIEIRLSRYFGLSEHFWLNLQTRYDLEVEKDRLAERLVQEVRLHSDLYALIAEPMGARK